MKLEQVNQAYASWIDQNFAEWTKPTNDPSYFLETHPVFEPSQNTKCRVVMNAASKDKQGLSLNDQLLLGPSLHSDMVELLLRFRMQPIAITSDISKMFL